MFPDMVSFRDWYVYSAEQTFWFSLIFVTWCVTGSRFTNLSLKYFLQMPIIFTGCVGKFCSSLSHKYFTLCPSVVIFREYSGQFIENLQLIADNSIITLFNVNLWLNRLPSLLPTQPMSLIVCIRHSIVNQTRLLLMMKSSSKLSALVQCQSRWQYSLLVPEINRKKMEHCIRHTECNTQKKDQINNTPKVSNQKRSLNSFRITTKKWKKFSDWKLLLFAFYVMHTCGLSLGSMSILEITRNETALNCVTVAITVCKQNKKR